MNAYEHGFIDFCKQAGIDPVELIKRSQEQEKKEKSRINHKFVGGTAGTGLGFAGGLALGNAVATNRWRRAVAKGLLAASGGVLGGYAGAKIAE